MSTQNATKTEQINLFCLNLIEKGEEAGLYRHLCQLGGKTWHASFAEVERVLGCPLPVLFRRERSWWNNQRGRGISYACAWLLAGYEVQDLDLVAETVTFRYTGDRRVDCSDFRDENAPRDPLFWDKVFAEWDRTAPPRDKNAPRVKMRVRRADMYKE